ncbi:hypothetical protein NIES2104_13120 [Leptolyngbya sp. NIES-2104]|nr:hypothetical protein NIES2104_13120 [Leptolyngbya sp. NIES-2104]
MGCRLHYRSLTVALRYAKYSDSGRYKSLILGDQSVLASVEKPDGIECPLLSSWFR